MTIGRPRNSASPSLIPCNVNRKSALAALILLTLACRGESPEGDVHPLHPAAPIIIISIDTVRADHLAPFGGSGAATPSLDALARESVVFENAWSHVPLTLPSHLTMLTGLMPFEHGVRSNIGYSFDGTASPSLPRLLAERGWATGAAVSAFVLRGATGIGAEFDFYDDAIEARPGEAVGLVDRPGDRTAAIAADWIARQGERPFLFLLHLFEPHSPYVPPAEFAGAQTPYDGEIAAADAVMGRFLDRLRSLGVYDRAVIVVLSDHGEGLDDHGEPEHGIFLYREALHVPLMIRLPGGAAGGRKVSHPVGLADVSPTLLRIAGLEAPDTDHARSLFSPFDPGRTIYAETMYPRIHLGWSDLRSMTGESLHFIEAPRSELYDYRADPGERRNLISERRREAGALRDALGSMPRALAAPQAVSAEETARLQALGYLGGASSAIEGKSLPDPKDRIGVIAQMRAAFKASMEGSRPEAIAMLRDVVAGNPGLTDAWARLGQLLEQEGDLDGAAEVYQTAIRAEPRLASEFALSLASIYYRRGELEKAREHAELALTLNPGAAHLDLGHIELAAGDLEAARRHADAARSHGTHRIAGSLLLAEILGREGRFAAGLDLLDRLKGEVGRPVEWLEYTRGDLLARLARFDEAVAAFLEEIEAFPKNRRAYIGLATVSRVRGDLEGARRAMAAMVAADPGESSRRTAARTLQELDDPAGAARW